MKIRRTLYRTLSVRATLISSHWLFHQTSFRGVHRRSTMPSLELLLAAAAITCTTAALTPPHATAHLAALRARAPLSATAPTNFTVEIPMRDGVTLHSVIYLPANMGAARVGCIHMRTPYSTESLAAEAIELSTIGWAVVTQDERGKFASKGNYTMWRSAANDTYDTQTFITDQAWSNGKIGWTGGSANAIMGYVAPMAVPGSPPAMASQFNLVGTTRLHEFEYQGGAYREELISGWLVANGEAPFISIVQANEGWSDFWLPTTQDYGARWGLTHWPILHLAGWYDIFSTLQVGSEYQCREQRSSVGHPQCFLLFVATAVVCKYPSRMSVWVVSLLFTDAQHGEKCSHPEPVGLLTSTHQQYAAISRMCISPADQRLLRPVHIWGAGRRQQSDTGGGGGGSLRGGRNCLAQRYLGLRYRL